MVVKQEVHDYLKSLCPSLHITRGEYDEDARYPETKTLTIGQFKLGLCHGHQVKSPLVLFFILTCRFTKLIYCRNFACTCIMHISYIVQI